LDTDKQSGDLIPNKSDRTIRQQDVRQAALSGESFGSTSGPTQAVVNVFRMDKFHVVFLPKLHWEQHDRKCF
jgi:hypothetical protein